jgi:hypothetical protein
MRHLRLSILFRINARPIGVEAIFQAEACDGFVISPAYLPGSFEEFVEEVVPDLQQRGLLRVEYSGMTLREHLGVKKPN